MTRTAPLSYTSQFGYYGLRVNPTLESTIGSVRKPLRIPLPDRKDKWYALSPYRALILDAQQKYQDYEHASLDHDHTLPEAAARVHASAAGEDESFEHMRRQHEAMQEQSAYQGALDVLNQERRRQTRQVRAAQLSQNYAHVRAHPVIEASSPELAEANVPHVQPLPRKGFPVPKCPPYQLAPNETDRVDLRPEMSMRHHQCPRQASKRAIVDVAVDVPDC
jgi:hypothetical protein